MCFLHLEISSVLDAISVKEIGLKLEIGLFRMWDRIQVDYTPMGCRECVVGLRSGHALDG